MHIFLLEIFKQRSKSIFPLRDSGKRFLYKGKIDFYITSQTMNFRVFFDMQNYESLYRDLVSQLRRIFACLLKEKGIKLSIALFRTDSSETDWEMLFEKGLVSIHVLLFLYSFNNKPPLLLRQFIELQRLAT